MHDARWIQAEHNSRSVGKPWFGCDMDWASCKLWLLNIDDGFMFATPSSSNYLHLSLIVENRFSNMVNARVPLFSMFWSIAVVSYRANISPFTTSLTLLILKESHHIPLHSASLSAPCAPLFLSSAFFRAIKTCEPCKAEFWGSWSLERVRKGDSNLYSAAGGS